MDANKSVNEELQGQKSTNMLIGYVLSLALMFVAFEYTQREVKIVETDKIYEMKAEEDMIPITHQEEQMAPPPAAAPTVMEVINEVEDDTEMPEQEIQSTEEVNQAITTNTGTTGAPVVVQGPVGPVVEEDEDNRVYDLVEKDAVFPGGEAAMYKWIQDHLNYPAIARDQEIQGKVMVQFIVNKDGSIEGVKILRTPDASLSKEAERVIKLMPKWTAARQGNKPVRSYFRIPIVFRLN